MKHDLLSAIAVAFLLNGGSLAWADWPQFGGPTRDGVAVLEEGQSLVREEPSGGLPALWKHAVGPGFAAPVVAEGLAVIYHRQGEYMILEALDSTSGEPRWKTEIPTQYRDDFGFDPGPRSSPTIASGKVFTYGPDGMFHAHDLKSGRLLWNHDLAKEVGSPKGFFGRACSPLVAGNLVLLNAGEPGKGVVAFQVEDGTPVWTASTAEASYSSPVLLPRSGGDPVAVFFTREGLSIVDSAKGEVLGEAAFRPGMHASVNAARPVIIPPDRIFLTTSYGVGAGLWHFNEDGLRELWKDREAFDAHYATPVLFEGHLYGFSGRQETRQTIRCIEAATGTVRWNSERFAAGSILRVGSDLVALTERGELVLGAASPDGFEPFLRSQILKSGHRSAPSFSDGCLFARDGENAICVRIVRPVE